MKASLNKDQKIRSKYHTTEKNQIIKKYLFREYLNDININNIKNIVNKFAKNILIRNFKTKNNTKSKIVRRCVLTGRSRSSLRILSISRIKLKEMILHQKVTNIFNQSW